MTLTDKTQPSQTNTVALEVELRHAPAKVWRALTDPVLLAEWLLPAVGLKLERGATFQLQGPPQPGWDGVVNCAVLDVEPERKLSYRWVVGELDTVVTFTIAATAEGTLLSLVQFGFTSDQRQNFAGARYGLKMMCERLIALLARS